MRLGAPLATGRPRRPLWVEVAVLVLLALVVAILVKAFLVQAYVIPSASMQPTLRAARLDDTRFTVCPWWDGPITREEVGIQLAAAAQDRPARWVWIYHAPPAGTPLCHDGRRTFPDVELAEWIGQHRPDLVFCGHIHQAPWVEGGGTWHARLGETWVFNAGKQIGKVPPHITLDTEAATADWFGVFSSEKVSLDAQ